MTEICDLMCNDDGISTFEFCFSGMVSIRYVYPLPVYFSDALVSAHACTVV